MAFIQAGVSVDRLLKYQYENYYEAWLEDGRPDGFFFKPKEGSIFNTIFITPDPSEKKGEWIDGDKKALYLYKKYMFWSKVAKISAACFFINLFVWVI